MKPAQLFLLDDDATFATAVCAAMTEDGIAVHAFTDRHAFGDYVERHRRAAGAALVVATRLTPGEAFDRLCRDCAPVPVVATTERASLSHAVERMRRGAAYVLHKPFPPATLANVLDLVTPDVEALDAKSTQETDDVRARLASLSPRQRQILGQVFEGRINKVIAHRLGISIKTVELHRARMMTKMRAGSAVELIRMTAPYSAMLSGQAHS